MLLAIAMLASGFASEVFAWALVIMQGHGRGRGTARGAGQVVPPLCQRQLCCILYTVSVCVYRVIDHNFRK